MADTKNRWLIAASAVGIHLSIGCVYAWSVFVKPIVRQSEWGFSRMLKNVCERCHSERSEESRSGNEGHARFLVACGSSE